MKKTQQGITIKRTSSTIIFIYLLICGMIAPASIINQAMKKTSQDTFNDYVKKYQEDPLAKEIAEVCKEENYTLNEIFCVNTIISEEYNFTKPEKGVKSPSKTLSEGGVCRDWSVTNAVILKKLGWNTQFIIIPGHTFIVADKKNYYCIIDGKSTECQEMKE